jgi:hypothetical protein
VISIINRRTDFLKKSRFKDLVDFEREKKSSEGGGRKIFILPTTTALSNGHK